MILREFNEKLQHSLDHVPDGVVKDAALYSLMNGGKRFRPQLLFSTLDAYHANVDKGLRAAIAIEMIHTYSLVHDDLPAMDDDTLRRGNPTCHIKYGEDIAILAGDALLSEAFRYANSATDNFTINNSIVEKVVDCCGLNGMIYGQELDMRNVNQNVTIEDLKSINLYKTSKLIILSILVGVYIADKQGDKDTWEEIGNNIGLIFQIQDDLLDCNLSSEELGKDANSDAKNNKVTYASLLGKEKCSEVIQELHKQTLGLLDTIIIDKNPIIDILDQLLNRKK